MKKFTDYINEKLNHDGIQIIESVSIDFKGQLNESPVHGISMMINVEPPKTYNYFPAPEVIARLSQASETAGVSADNALETYLKNLQETVNAQLSAVVTKANLEISDVLKKHNIKFND